MIERLRLTPSGIWRLPAVLAGFVLLSGATAQATLLTPVRLVSGANRLPDIAGTGDAGTVTLMWRENGNAWGYDLFIVEAGGSIATINGKDSIADAPHVGEDVIRSVRFARGAFRGRTTLHVLVASRTVVQSTYDAAKTKIEQFALIQNDSGTGTPYEFVPVRSFTAGRLYCNAEMALKTELGLPLTRSYSGPKTTSGCS